MNTSREDYVISRHTYVGQAEEVEVCSEERKLQRGSCSDSVTELTPSQNVEVSFETETIDHIQPILQSLPKELSDEQKEKATEFIRSYADLFSKTEFDIGRTPLVQHVIDTGHHRPFKQQLRRHPLTQLSVIDEHVEKMLANDIYSSQLRRRGLRMWCWCVVKTTDSSFASITVHLTFVHVQTVIHCHE